MQDVGLETIETYITCCQNTIYQYIATNPILEMCLVEKRFPEKWGGVDWEGEQQKISYLHRGKYSRSLSLSVNYWIPN